MTYSTREISNQDGQPIALYLFTYGNTEWRYCTADEDKAVGLDDDGNPIIWRAHTIIDEGVTQGGSDQNDLQITVQSDNPVAALFRITKPSKVWLSVRRYHLGDAETETPLLWSGTVVNSSRVDKATDQLACRSLGGTYDRNGLRLAYDRSCPHPLYGIGCYVPKEEHAYPRVIATVDGTSFTCTAHSDPEEGSFTGGFVEWSRGDGSFDRRGIEEQIGNHFLLLGTTDGLVVGSEVTAYPGCFRNTPNCKAFNNLPNYGGFPHLPGKSPFDGTPVF
jgi:hypothetical protein